MNPIYIENTGISHPLDEKWPESTDVEQAVDFVERNRQELTHRAVQAAQDAMEGRDNIDAVYVTSQTFLEYVMPGFLEELVLQTGISPSTVVYEKVFSSAQPVWHDVFRRVQETRQRVLMVGIEGLSLLDPEKRPEIIGEGLGPALKDYKVMANAIGWLARAWMERYEIPEETFRQRLMEVALTHYRRAAKVPHGQFYGKSFDETKYRKQESSRIDTAGMLSMMDCAPGHTSQVAAAVVSADATHARARVQGFSTIDDPRSPMERFCFKSVGDEANSQALQEVLKMSRLSHEALTRHTHFEIHNAFGPLMFMTLHELGLIEPSDLHRPWDEMGKVDKTYVNRMGGLKLGHFLGGTALGRLHENVQQLTDNAPDGLKLPASLERAYIQSVSGARNRLSATLIARV